MRVRKESAKGAEGRAGSKEKEPQTPRSEGNLCFLKMYAKYFAKKLSYREFGFRAFAGLSFGQTDVS